MAALNVVSLCYQ